MTLRISAKVLHKGGHKAFYCMTLPLEYSDFILKMDLMLASVTY